MRCEADAKSTGERCRRSAKTGYNVCRVHGANAANPGGAPIRNTHAVKHGAYETLMRERMGEEDAAIFDRVSVDPVLSGALRIIRYKILRLIGDVDQNVHGKEKTWTVKADELEKNRAIAYLVSEERKLVKEMQGGTEDDPIDEVVKMWKAGLDAESVRESRPIP